MHQSDISISHLRAQLDSLMDQQRAAFQTCNQNIETLLHQRSDFIDELLTKLWHAFDLHNKSIALFAVGGFGRRELHPLSDIDFLILTETPLTKVVQDKVSSFVALLWDLKLVVGHSVRTLQECEDIGAQDLSVATSLQEARFIIGDSSLLEQLKKVVFKANFWPSIDFFHAKVLEQKARHAKYNNTAYHLEPDIKSSPGGLRDIHTLSWIARRHFGATSLAEMSKHGFLTDTEFDELNQCLHYLWSVRFALHLLLKRADDRLTFSHQLDVAKMLGFAGENNAAIERMMKEFYRTLSRVTNLNQMLIDLFSKEIDIEKFTENQNIYHISEDFQRNGSEIAASKPTLFHEKAESILDMFIYIANDDSIESISAPTLRQLRAVRQNLTYPLSSIAAARKKFVTLIKHPNVLNKAIPLMHKYGVFSAYLPQWKQIVGQMQFDLFHVYTVDEHTVRLLNNFNLFSDSRNKDSHPICCELYPRLAKPEILFLAAIFHDIAKGRGGDHSEIGAIEAYDFCLNHHFSETEASMVSWLVDKHLVMSVTAQRRDIYDPQVIKEFAREVQNEERLNYLICLTVADICATNPTLWNSWKRTLLAELYHATQNVLRRGNMETLSHAREKIRSNKHIAKEALLNQGITGFEIHMTWKRFKAEYFMRHNAAQIIWHTKKILAHKSDCPLVLITDKNTKGNTEIFIHAKDKPTLFARVVDALDRKNLSVHDAQIMTSKDGFTLDTFIVLDTHHKSLSQDRYQNIIDGIICAINKNDELKMTCRTAPKKLMAFNIKPEIAFLPTQSNNKTLIELIALDTPGLLAKIGATFARLNISLQAAKITTIGERAEDFFIVANQSNRALDEQAKQELKASLYHELTQ